MCNKKEWNEDRRRKRKWRKKKKYALLCIRAVPIIRVTKSCDSLIFRSNVFHVVSHSVSHFMGKIYIRTFENCFWSSVGYVHRCPYVGYITVGTAIARFKASVTFFFFFFKECRWWCTNVDVSWYLEINASIFGCVLR